MVINAKGEWKLYFDGAANKNGYGIGILLISPDQVHSPLSFRLQFDCTNNTVEYEACTVGLEIALTKGVTRIQVFGDSALIIHQILRKWKIKEEKLIPYLDRLQDMANKFKWVKFHRVPRSQNNFANALTTLSSMVEIPNDMQAVQITIEQRELLAYCLFLKSENKEMVDTSTWYYDIWKVLKEGKYPEGVDKKTRIALRRLAAQFIICSGKLYKMSHDGIHLRCLKEEELQPVMSKIHRGECGPHTSGHTLARKIVRQGYYWTTMQHDCNNHVKRCHLCQVYVKSQKLPPKELYTMTAPWPFSVWGIENIGKISPSASNGHEYILVAIDYFTKWVEAESYVKLDAMKVAKFIRRNIICRYEVPHEIVSDNGTHFEGEANEVMEEYGIQRYKSSPYSPQTNGAVEAANKNLKNVINKMVKNGRDWADKLPYALWGYRTTERVSVNATPFSLTYGMEAVLPLEIEISSLRVILESSVSELDWVQSRYEELALLDEKRLTAAYHQQGYQKRVAKAFNQEVRIRGIQADDLVLNEIREPARDPRAKFAQKWTRPYIIKKILSGETVVLTDTDGQQFSSPVNLDRLKKYYQ